jgi:malonyl-CoA O-methyltransferase
MKPTLNKAFVQKRFGKGAKEYDDYALVQKRMGQQLIEKLLLSRKGTDQPLNILEIGCGTGYVTGLLLERFPQAHITAMDISAEMLEVASGKYDGLYPGRVKWVQADAEEWAVAAEVTKDAGIAKDVQAAYATQASTHAAKVSEVTEPNSRLAWDMIVSNATVQWFHDPLDAMRRYGRLLNTGGAMAFATFGPRTFHELHHSFAEAEKRVDGEVRVHHGQTFPSKRDWEEALHGDGALVLIEEEEIVERHPSVREFLRSVQKIGASNASTGTGRSHTSRRVMQAMIEEYDSRYRVSEKDGSFIPSTYHCVYGYYITKN